MANTPFLTPAVRGRGGTTGRPSMAFGTFVMNGAGAVTDVSGIVSSVERFIDDASALPFFRVTFSANYPWSRAAAISSRRGANYVHADPVSPAATVITSHFGTGTLAVTVPVAALATQEDIIVMDAGAAHDTVGTVVSLGLMFDS